MENGDFLPKMLTKRAMSDGTGKAGDGYRSTLNSQDSIMMGSFALKRLVWSNIKSKC